MEGHVTSEWHFMTLRKFPRLAKVETQIWIPDPSAPGYKEDGEWIKSEGCLVVRFPFSPDTDFTLEGLKNYGKILAAKMAGRNEPMLEFRLPFNPLKERIKSKGYKSEVLRIWKDAPEALDVGSEIDPEVLAKLKYTLGTSNPVTLFRIDTNKYREVYKCAPKKEEVGFQTSIGMQDSVGAIAYISCSAPGRTTLQCWQLTKLVPNTPPESCLRSRCSFEASPETKANAHASSPS